jgi:hypothetical protein
MKKALTLLAFAALSVGAAPPAQPAARCFECITRGGECGCSPEGRVRCCDDNYKAVYCRC